MPKQKSENLMLNKSICAYSLARHPSRVWPVLTLFLTLFISACSVTQEETSTDKNIKLSSANREVFAQAISAMKSGDTANAQALLIDLINQQPNYSNAHVNLGIIFITNKSFSEAENAFNRALQINPNNIYALNQLGFLYRTKGDFSNAKANYEKAININSDYANAHLNLGILYDLYLYDLENAIEQYKIYKKLLKDSDKQVDKWIFDLERRLKKSVIKKQEQANI